MNIYTQSRAVPPLGWEWGLWWEWGCGGSGGLWWKGVSGGGYIRNNVVPYKRSALLCLQRQLFGTGTGSLGLSERISCSLFYASLYALPNTRDLPAN